MLHKSSFCDGFKCDKETSPEFASMPTEQWLGSLPKDLLTTPSQAIM